MFHPRLVTAAAAVVAFGAAGFGPVSAQDFYAGKTVKIAVGFSPGGGYDAYGRLVARHIGQHVPGKPTVIVQNMPGASSMKAVKFLDAGAPADGTVMTIFNAGLISQSLTSPDKVTVDFTKLRFVGSVTSDVRLCYFWGATGIKTWEDLLKRKEVVMGATAVGSSSYINGRVIKNMFGANIRHVLGYPGSTEQRLAIERGELDGDCGAWGSTPAHWIRDGKINMVVRFSRAAAPDMPKMPYILDLARNAEERQILNLILAPSEIGRPFVMSAKVPEARFAVLRGAFRAMIKDEAFLAEAAKGRREVIGPMTGEEVEAAIRDIYAAPKAVIARASEMVK